MEMTCLYLLWSPYGRSLSYLEKWREFNVDQRLATPIQVHVHFLSTVYTLCLCVHATMSVFSAKPIFGIYAVFGVNARR